MFQFASGDLRNDETFVLRAVARNCHVLQYVDESLRNNREFMIKCVRIDHNSLKYACDETWRNDKEFILVFIRENSESLCHAPVELKKDKGVVLEAVKHSKHKPANSFKYASTTLQSEMEFVKQCVAIDTRVLLHASEQLLRDDQFMMDCFRMDDSLRNNVDFLWKIVNAKNPYDVVQPVLILKGIELYGAPFLERVPIKLRNSGSLMVRAAKQNRECLQFASETLLNDEQRDINKIQDESSSLSHRNRKG